MGKLSTFVRQNNIPKERYTTLSLSDGCLRGTTCQFEYDEFRHRINKHKAADYQPYTLNVSDFLPISKYTDLSFRIPAEVIKHLYGTCKVSLYLDDEASDVELTFRNPRIIIENEAGWYVASEAVEYLVPGNTYAHDSLFSQNYDDDYLDDKKVEDESPLSEEYDHNIAREILEDLSTTTATHESMALYNRNNSPEKATVLSMAAHESSNSNIKELWL